jgi:hypothetical protein
MVKIILWLFNQYQVASPNIYVAYLEMDTSQQLMVQALGSAHPG